MTFFKEKYFENSLRKNLPNQKKLYITVYNDARGKKKKCAVHKGDTQTNISRNVLCTYRIS